MVTVVGGCGIPAKTRTISAREFKDRCLALIDEVAETGEEMLITKDGKPLCRLLPAEELAAGGVEHGPFPAVVLQEVGEVVLSEVVQVARGLSP